MVCETQEDIEQTIDRFMLKIESGDDEQVPEGGKLTAREMLEET